MSFKKGKSNSKYETLGTFCLKKKENPEEPNAYHIKLGKDVKLTINGKEVDGLYLDVKKPEVKFDRMLAKGIISQEERNEKVAEFQEKGRLSFVKFDITATVK